MIIVSPFLCRLTWIMGNLYINTGNLCQTVPLSHKRKYPKAKIIYHGLLRRCWHVQTKVKEDTKFILRSIRSAYIFTLFKLNDVSKHYYFIISKFHVFKCIDNQLKTNLVHTFIHICAVYVSATQVLRTLSQGRQGLN